METAAVKMDRIYLGSSQDGLLDWLDVAQSHPEGRLPFTYFTEKSYSKLRSDASREKWAVEAFRNSGQPFLNVLQHMGSGLDMRVEKERQLGPGYYEVEATVSVHALLGLPGDEPEVELSQYRDFLNWIQAKRDRIRSERPNEIGIQWYRGGYNCRGLEWYGLSSTPLSDSKRQEWEDELQDWRSIPWFEAWYKKNMEGLARVRMGPHCFFRLSNLRDYSVVLEQLRKKNASDTTGIQKVIAPGP